MVTIHKFPLSTETLQPVQLPREAQLLTVQLQGAGYCLWVLLDDAQPFNTTYSINCVRTGGVAPNTPRSQRYLSTTQNDWLVLHWFGEDKSWKTL